MEYPKSTEIEKYINDSRASGIPDEDIKNNLLTSGWTEKALSSYFQIPDSATKPKRKWLKISGIIIVSFVAFGLFMFFVMPQILNVFWGSDIALNDTDVRLDTVSVLPQEQNSYYDIIKLKDLVQEPTKADGDITTKYLAGQSLDPTIESQIIQKNINAYLIINAAVNKSYFQDPTFSDLNKFFSSNMASGWTDTSYSDYLPSLRASMRLSVLYADYVNKAGRPKEALDQLFKTITLSQQIQKSQTILPHYLVTLAMEKGAILKIEEIINTNNLTREEKSFYLNKLTGPENNVVDFSRALKSEYINDLLLVDSSVKTAGITKSNYTFKPNETKNMFAEQTRKTISAANLSCDTPINLVPQHYFTNSFYVYTALWRINSVGKLLFDMVAVDLSASITKKCEVDTLFNNLRSQLSR